MARMSPLRIPLKWFLRKVLNTWPSKWFWANKTASTRANGEMRSWKSCKSSHLANLLYSFTRENVRKMLKFIITMPPEGCSHDRGHTMPFVANEIFLCEMATISSNRGLFLNNWDLFTCEIYHTQPSLDCTPQFWVAIERGETANNCFIEPMGAKLLHDW